MKKIGINFHKSTTAREIYCGECGYIKKSTGDGRVCDDCADRIETESEFPTESSMGIDPYDY